MTTRRAVPALRVSSRRCACRRAAQPASCAPSPMEWLSAVDPADLRAATHQQKRAEEERDDRQPSGIRLHASRPLSGDVDRPKHTVPSSAVSGSRRDPIRPGRSGARYHPRAHPVGRDARATSHLGGVRGSARGFVIRAAVRNRRGTLSPTPCLLVIPAPPMEATRMTNGRAVPTLRILTATGSPRVAQWWKARATSTAPKHTVPSSAVSGSRRDVVRSGHAFEESLCLKWPRRGS
jgi:hypothetical protein